MGISYYLANPLQNIMSHFKQINTKPNSLLTFDNYFNNQKEVIALKKTIITNEAESLIFSGSNGSGVTHLLNAICNSQIKQNKKVFFITAQWLIYVKKNLKTQADKEAFINSILKHDVIAIDNIQFFYRKTKHQNQFIHNIISKTANSNKLVFLGCSEPQKDFSKSKKIKKTLALKRVELLQLSSFDVYSILKNLCSLEDNIPDNLLYAISGYNGSIQQYINCLISIRFNISSQNIPSQELSIEEFDDIFNLKKYFHKQQLRKCFIQTQLKFPKHLSFILEKTN